MAKLTIESHKRFEVTQDIPGPSFTYWSKDDLDVPKYVIDEAYEIYKWDLAMLDYSSLVVTDITPEGEEYREWLLSFDGGCIACYGCYESSFYVDGVLYNAIISYGD